MAFKSQVTITRPANTTAYTAGDVVGSSTATGGAVLEFKDMASTIGRDIVIQSADIKIYTSAVRSGETSYTLRFANASIPSALADNAAYDLAAGDRASYLGKLDLGSPADEGSTLACELNGIGKQLRLGSNETSLYAYLVTNGGYTPGSGDVIVVTLHAFELRN